MPKTAVLSCTVFKNELTAVANQLLPVPELFFEDSTLHMEPEKLAAVLQSRVESLRSAGYGVVLCYGDCQPFMHELAEQPAVVKVKGCNCVDIILGREERRKHLKEGAFFLFYDWTVKHKEIFKELQGLTDDSVRVLFHEQNKKLLYLDTGISPVPIKELQECSAEFQLPCSVDKISTEYFKNNLQDALNRLQIKLNPERDAE